MSTPADTVTTVLARDIVVAVQDRGLRVFAITSPVSLVAGLMAQRLGAPSLALAGGFGRLDATPRPAVISGEFALGLDSAPHSMSAETFMALARGRVGVVTSPAQIDTRAALNLSGVGGTHDRPVVALPGSRGLPDNNHSRSNVWYFVPDISPRRLVPEVDFVSGAPPGPGIRRLLLAPTAALEFDAASGWRIMALAAGVTADEVRASCGFDLAGQDPPAFVEPSAYELDVMVAVDPHGLRRLDFGAVPGHELASVIAAEERELAATGSLRCS